MTLANLYDITVMINSDPKKKKPPKYPRPFDIKAMASKNGNINDDEATVGKNAISREKAIAILNKMNPQS